MRLWTSYARKLEFVTINRGDIMKKFTALLLIFSLMAISCTTMTTQRQKRVESSKEGRGAKLIVTKKHGRHISGELITVKPNSLLLLDGKSGVDVSVDFKDIKIIKIIKKSKFWKGSLYGLLLGGGLGVAAIVSAISKGEEEIGVGEVILGTALYGAIAGAVGYLIGGIIGASLGKEVTIQIEGMTDSEIREALDKLRKKARIRDYK